MEFVFLYIFWPRRDRNTYETDFFLSRSFFLARTHVSVSLSSYRTVRTYDMGATSRNLSDLISDLDDILQDKDVSNESKLDSITHDDVSYDGKVQEDDSVDSLLRMTESENELEGSATSKNRTTRDRTSTLTTLGRRSKQSHDVVLYGSTEESTERMICLKCDFDVLRFSRARWSDKADYMFFRYDFGPYPRQRPLNPYPSSNYSCFVRSFSSFSNRPTACRNYVPDRMKLREMLRFEDSSYCAYACQVRRNFSFFFFPTFDATPRIHRISHMRTHRSKYFSVRGSR